MVLHFNHTFTINDTFFTNTEKTQFQPLKAFIWKAMKWTHLLKKLCSKVNKPKYEAKFSGLLKIIIDLANLIKTDG